MKIFRAVQKQYAILGVSSSHQPNQKCPLNRRELFCFLIFGCLLVSHFVYLMRVASDFMEYMECLLSTSAGFIASVCFAAVALRKTTLFESIGAIEQLIDTSECSNEYFSFNFILGIFETTFSFEYLIFRM